MTSNNYITCCFQSAAKLAIFIILTLMSVDVLAQPPSTKDSAAKDTKVLQSVQDLLALIPNEIDTRPGGEWNAAAISKASDILRAVSFRKPVKLTFNARSMKDGIKGCFTVYGNFTQLPEPYPYKVYYNAKFGPDDTDYLSKLVMGSDITVTGTINGAALSLDRQTATMSVIISSDSFNEFWGISPTPAAPAPHAVPTPATLKLPPKVPTIPTTATPQQVDPAVKRIVLAKDCDTQMQGGSATTEDLGRLFNGFARPGADFAGDDSIIVYPGIPYLTPVRQAMETLRPGVRMPSKLLVSCPGFPRDSFYYYAIDGLFEGHYNRAYAVVDRADQVVSVQLVDEHPRNQNVVSVRDEGWHTYNFVNYRTKSMNTLHIEHLLDYWSKDQWNETKSGSRAAAASDLNSFRIRSKLLDPIRHHTQGVAYIVGDAKVLEDVEWFVPRPVAELILTCVQKSAK